MYVYLWRRLRGPLVVRVALAVAVVVAVIALLWSFALPVLDSWLVGGSPAIGDGAG